MDLQNLLFGALVLLTVIPAILVSTTLNIVRAACWLLLSLSGAAGLFFFLGADFVGATQLLIYVGGTLVLVIFGVMLTATGPFVNLSARSGDWAISILAGSALFGLIAFALLRGDVNRRPIFQRNDGTAEATTNRIGLAFLGAAPAEDVLRVAKMPGVDKKAKYQVVSYLLPFEIVSLHLVVVLIGAAYLARAKRKVQTR